jgi:nucleoside-diphosphate-sugar epimerase
MKVLFIGGTGVISSACSKRAIEKGFALYHLNRGKSCDKRPNPVGVQTIFTDVRDFDSASKALQNYSFDVVVDWISYLPEQLENSMQLFQGKARQFVYISSASAYQTPPQKLPVTENTPLDNPFWQYSREKIACENILTQKAADYGFDYTIVRPSHTYDHTTIPASGGYTAVHRMRTGKPVIVMGDGTSIWTLTHNSDFAKGFVGLLGNELAFNESFHITSDEWLTWNQIFEIVADAFGTKPTFVHVPSEWIVRYDPVFGAGLLGDKSHSMIFDNSKIKKVVPDFICTTSFREGFQETAKWFMADPQRQAVNEELNKVFDRIIYNINQLEQKF